jgi:exodeoxyribonuclease V alpha subunit
MHKGVVGVENLNRELQKALNPATHDPRSTNHELERFGRLFRVGDKVMQLVNDYDKGVFNGDLGIIQQIDREKNTVDIRFDDVDVGFEFTDMDDVVPAYATTIHKSQGSEYPCVIIPVLTQHYVMLQRNLIYTAITRGRRLVVLIGTPKALAIAINNNQTAQRFGLLKQRLTTELV